ncbi:major facilitator superfamily antibiotic efflux pump [compost metagenome]
MGLWGFGNGLVLPSLLNLALKNVPSQYAGAAAGIYSTFQQTASALGVSIIGGIFFYYSQQSWQLAYKAGTIAILVCVVMVGIMLQLLPSVRATRRKNSKEPIHESIEPFEL